MLCYKICCLLYCWPVALATISATKCKGKHLPTPPPDPESSEGCVWRKMMRNGELAEKNEHRVTQVPWPKGCPQKETHLISITQRWQQLATLPLHLPRHHFVILGQTWTLSSRGDTGRWCIIRRWHIHAFQYIMQQKDPVLGISIALTDIVLYDSESRFIFHILRARVGGNMELRCKFPQNARLGILDRNGDCHLFSSIQSP